MTTPERLEDGRKIVALLRAGEIAQAVFLALKGKEA